MSLIGTFTTTSDGFTGHIKTLLLDAELTISPLTRPISANPPDFIITLGKSGAGPLVGSARKKQTERGNDFISIRIDDPSLANPICCGLFPAEQSIDRYNLYWSRPRKWDDKP